MLEAFINKLFGSTNSKSTAKNRLQMVLVQDRSGLTSEEMESFRKDLLDVISRYFSLEKRSVEIEWHRTESETALMINTPVVSKIRAVKSAVG
jgi:cell division topological specificity factor